MTAKTLHAIHGANSAVGAERGMGEHVALVVEVVSAP
jgi:hypothetical protein